MKSGSKSQVWVLLLGFRYIDNYPQDSKLKYASNYWFFRFKQSNIVIILPWVLLLCFWIHLSSSLLFPQFRMHFETASVGVLYISIFHNQISSKFNLLQEKSAQIIEDSEIVMGSSRVQFSRFGYQKGWVFPQILGIFGNTN